MQEFIPSVTSARTSEGGATEISDEVAACVRSHTSWMLAQAEFASHAAWSDDSVQWAWSADGRTLHAVFPDETPAAVIERGVERADSLGATEVAIWSSIDVARPELEALGFQIGWQPCWMVAPAVDFLSARTSPSDRVCLTATARPHEAHLEPLLGRHDTWRAEAQDQRRYAGRGWLHLSGGVAGLYDMAVWPRFQRSGLGRELVGLLGATAVQRGARCITLNATPEGEQLYTACGFTKVGAGRTWWRHLHSRA